MSRQRSAEDLDLWTYTVQESKGVYYVVATLSSEIFTSDMDQELRSPRVRVFIGRNGILKEYSAHYDRKRGAVIVGEKSLAIPFSNRSKIFASRRALSGSPIFDSITGNFMGYFDANSEGLQIYNQQDFGHMAAEPVVKTTTVAAGEFNLIEQLGEFIVPPIDVVTPVSYEKKRMANRRLLPMRSSTSSVPQVASLPVVLAVGISTPVIDTWLNEYPVTSLEHELAVIFRQNDFPRAMDKIGEMINKGKDDVALTTYVLRVLRELDDSEYLAQATDLLVRLFATPSQHGLAAAFARFTLPKYLGDSNQEYFKKLVRSYSASQNSIGQSFLEEHVIGPLNRKNCVKQLEAEKLLRLK